MSNPLTNLEIQDVLSSIRRLVSEDKRARTDLPGDIKAPSAPLSVRGNEGGTSDNPGKFVLTQALRIPDAEQGDEDRDIVADWASDADSDARDDLAGDDRAAASLEDTIAELEAAVAGADDQFEPDGSEVVRASDDDTEVLSEVFDGGFDVDVGDEPSVGAIDQAITSAPQETGENPGADEIPSPGENMADGDEPAGLAGQAGAEETGRESTKANSDEFAFDDADEAALLDEGPTEELGNDHSSDDEKLDEPISGNLVEAADPETADTEGGRNQNDKGAPDDDGGDAGDSAAGPGFAFGRADRERHRAMRPTIIRQGGAASEADAAKGLSRLTLTAADAAGGADVGDPWERDDASPAADSHEDVGMPASVEEDDSTTDEARTVEAGTGSLDVDEDLDAEILRDIVGEVIRAELQGPLGERITRNVRMLVRREINRALEARGLGGTSDRD